MAETQRAAGVAATAPSRKRWVFPQRAAPEEVKLAARPVERDTPKTLAVPFRGHISGGTQPGKKIIIFGHVDACPDRFYVALTCGPGTPREPPADVALELCARFRERQVFGRACRSGTWWEAERAAPFFPFIAGQPFKLEIRCERSRFRVLVDGEQLCDFHHQVASLDTVDTLWIKGCITITKLA